ncbi:MAG: hypothetical protein NT169_08455 [Chloroflexi bacterium]|nr:hypothetical protein [Chloroflexota bacterium]
MQTITLEVPEAQIIRWVGQLSPVAKRDVLKLLVPRLDEAESLVDYGEQRMRELSARRGLNWDRLPEDEREQLVDALLHEA